MRRKVGQVIAITGGEYSDYGILGFFKVLCDFDQKDAAQIYLENHDHQNSAYPFIAWLVRNDFVTQIDHREFYLGEDHNNLDLNACESEGYGRA